MEIHINPWVNFTMLLQIMTIFNIVFESLQAIRHILIIKGVKMKRGIFYKFKLFISILPVFGLFLYLCEVYFVLGFYGDSCFCKFK
mmetsp:Transcript_8489/g.14275  ORF Transcript_8489/g.14275 Transcript_8489/m.14275 type:complete len:86 (+) Transcript_8489:174-431(+)